MPPFQRKPESQGTYWNLRKAGSAPKRTCICMRMRPPLPPQLWGLEGGPGGRACGHLRPSFCRKEALWERAQTQRRRLQEL